MASITLKDVVKRYGTGPKANPVIHGVNAEIADHEFIVIVGPSGCGKSTLLRMVAGLEEISGGTISIGGRVVNDIEPSERDIAMVFQNYALYPHMSVFDNMAYGLKIAKVPLDEIKTRVDKAAKILELGPFLQRKPRELSGGQRQRVAMGRAIVRDPKVFLFDEPLSNLDAKLRVAMRAEIKALHQRLKTTTVYVTHDQVEAMTMADRIVVMNAGRIEQIGTPEDVFDRPHSRFVARFIGGSNLLEGTRVDGRRVDVAGHALDVGHGEFAGRGEPMSVCVKTHDMHIDADGRADGTNALPGVVRSQAYLGSHRDYIVDVGQPLLIAAPAALNIPAGSSVTVRFRPDRCRGIIR